MSKRGAPRAHREGYLGSLYGAEKGGGVVRREPTAGVLLACRFGTRGFGNGTFWS